MKVIGFCGLPGSGKSTALIAIEDLGIIILSLIMKIWVK
jgi:dephospho-CoA kinase